jgi:hypothetical protein
MRAGYDDIRALADKLGVQPIWWDTHGVPRYVEHRPDHAANIYADEAVLLRIACQLCGEKQLVQMTWSSMDTIRAQIHTEWAALTRGESKPDARQPSLAEFIRAGTIHYGDPPRHNDGNGEFCHAGCTMNCEDLAIVEYWHRGGETRQWQRDAELEIMLPTEDDSHG